MKTYFLLLSITLYLVFSQSQKESGNSFNVITPNSDISTPKFPSNINQILNNNLETPYNNLNVVESENEFLKGGSSNSSSTSSSSSYPQKSFLYGESGTNLQKMINSLVLSALSTSFPSDIQKDISSSFVNLADYDPNQTLASSRGSEVNSSRGSRSPSTESLNEDPSTVVTGYKAVQTSPNELTSGNGFYERFVFDSNSPPSSAMNQNE